jgi:hypothetical protein
MKIGIVVVVTRDTSIDHIFSQHVRNQSDRVQVMIWNVRGNFANFVDDNIGTAKTVLSHTSAHKEIVPRIQRMMWFQNCDATIIVNFGKVFFTVTDEVLELSSLGREYLTIVESKVPIKIGLKVNYSSDVIEALLKTRLSDSDWIKLLSHLREVSKHSLVLAIADEIKSSISSTNQYLVWYEESISSFYVKENQRGKEACEKLLNHPNIPEWMKNNVTSNLKYYQ